MKSLKLGLPTRSGGSYYRKEYIGDVLDRKYRHNGVEISFSRRASKIKDPLAEELLAMGLITPDQRDAYFKEVIKKFTGEFYYESSLEEVYEELHQCRKALLGTAPLEEWKKRKMQGNCTFDPQRGIDQRAVAEELLGRCKAVIFVLLQPEYFSLLQADLQKAAGACYLLTGEPGDLLPAPGTIPGVRELPAHAKGIAYDEELQQKIDRGEACLFVYGEAGLLECRSLAVESFVYADPRGYQSQTAAGQLSLERSCAVYVPKGLDITQWVRILQPTRCSYWQLYCLWRDHGMGIYERSILELYQQYPAYFYNIYENEPAEPLPLQVSGFQSLEKYDAEKEEALRRYLSGFENVRYYSSYFAPKEGAEGPGILVNGVRVKRSRNARVISCETTLRAKFRELNLPETGLASNFLFFMTAGLVNLYNALREDRPREQTPLGGHLDYMLFHRDGKRIETFPLFRKTCIAMKENGEFIFFNFRLGGGKATVNGVELSWTKEAVDTEALAPVRVYTPHLSLEDEAGERSTYRRLVGEGRLNLVILQDQIVCIRQGDVVLPSVGAVISLEEKLGRQLLLQWGLTPDPEGYCDVKGLEFSLHLDPPAEVDPAEWNTVQWSYGGGLSLILKGEGLDQKEDLEQWFRAEGWTSPLSRQTQESNLHSIVKHPRTAIGTTRSGELVVLVFSGRTRRSAGADYLEMCAIARELFPDIDYLMNVDGGGSAVLGLVHNGSFMELSLPSTSSGSCVGMVRTIKTVFYIPAE